MGKVICVIAIMLIAYPFKVDGWGFYAHKLINRHAVFSLPKELVGFYKAHINYITENAVNPDRRRYAVKGEAPRHYLDADHYGDSAIYRLPRRWSEAVAQYSEDTLQAYGIVPWHINLMKVRLTNAFAERDVEKILRISADLGHYVGDANVPLHTTENYNGQLTGQYGIHGFWESRLPELFSDNYDLFVGQCDYIERPQMSAWKAVTVAHEALDSVLSIEYQLTLQTPEDKKFGFEERGRSFVQVYSKSFSEQYHRRLNGMVERQMKASIKMVADFWYTCWVDAGQPDMSSLRLNMDEERKKKEEAEKAGWLKRIYQGRSHESGSGNQL